MRSLAAAMCGSCGSPTARERRLVRGGAPAWSPSGRRIAYIAPSGAVEIVGVHGGWSHRVGSVQGTAVDWQPSQSSQGHVCKRPAHASVLASNREAVVFSQRGERFYGCLKALGVTRLLLDTNTQSAFGGTLTAVRLAGRFAAFQPEYFNQYANWEDETLYDLSSGKATTLAHVAWECSGGCQSSTVDGLDFLALDSSGFAAWRETSGPIPAVLNALSCPSASLCVAGDNRGNILTSSEPLAGPDAWSIVAADQGQGIVGVSCPSVSMCVAVDGAGNIFVSTDPTRRRMEQDQDRSGRFSPGRLVRVGHAVRRRGCRIHNPHVERSGWRRERLEKHASRTPRWRHRHGGVMPVRFTVRGRGRDQCRRRRRRPNVDRSDGRREGLEEDSGRSGEPSGRRARGRRRLVPVGLDVRSRRPGRQHSDLDRSDRRRARLAQSQTRTTGSVLTTVSCPSISMCVAGDYTGNILTSTDPTGGKRAWTTAPADQGGLPAHHLDVVSCPSVSLCVAGDNNGDVLTSTDPTGGANAWSSASVDVPGCPQPSTPCTSERLLVRDDHGTEVVDTAPPGHGNSIDNVALNGDSLVLSWTHDGAQRQLQLR